jgi:hypothetical protein
MFNLRIVLLFIVGLYVISFLYYKTWTKQILAGGDSGGYYLYLPAFFIHHDVDSMHRTVAVLKKYYPGNPNEKTNALGINELYETENGKYCVRYTYGVSLMSAPFFIIAHCYALHNNYHSDGYSLPYVFMFCFSILFYSLLGLWLLYKCLKNIFKETIILWTVIAVFAATNLYHFAVYAAPMSHPYLFFLYCLLIFFTIKWHEAPSLKFLILIGLTAGMITALRPTEIICILIPLLYNVYSISSFKEKGQWLKQKYTAIPLLIIAFLIPLIPQLYYWKIVSGNWLYYSYGEEGFDFLRPHLLWGLFSFKNGWLAYTPVMFFALFGFMLMYKNPKFLLPIFIFIPIHIYITYSWWCWNYINGFGARPMISVYPLLAIPLAYFIQSSFKYKLWKWLVIFFILFFSWLNIFSTWQYSAGLLWTEDSNWAYQKRIFGKTSRDYLDFVTFDSGVDQPNDFSSCRTIYFNDFEDENHEHISAEQKSNGNYSYKLTSEREFGPEFSSHISNLDLNSNEWIKAEVSALTTKHPFMFYDMSVLVISFVRHGNPYVWKIIRIDNKLGNRDYSLWDGKAWVWDKVYFSVKIPKDIKQDDELKIYVWNPKKYDMYLDDFKIYVCSP